MGHFFLKNWCLYGSTFKFRGGTSLPKPNLSTPPPGLSIKQLFQLQKRLPRHGVSALSKMVLKKPRFFFFFFFWLKGLKFRVVWTIQFWSNFTSMWYKHFLRNVWRDFRLPMSALATAAGKSFNGKFTSTFDFPIGYFILLLLMLILEVWSLSIHYLKQTCKACSGIKSKNVYY